MFKRQELALSELGELEDWGILACWLDSGDFSTTTCAICVNRCQWVFVTVLSLPEYWSSLHSLFLAVPECRIIVL